MNHPSNMQVVFPNLIFVHAFQIIILYKIRIEETFHSILFVLMLLLLRY